MEITPRQEEILNFLIKKAQPARVYTVYGSQDKIARELNITRQALSIQLQHLKELGLVRTGQEFIDITEKAVKLLRGENNDVIILVSIEPKYRNKVYQEIKTLPIEKAYKITNDFDVVIITTKSVLDNVLNTLNNMEGVREVKALVSIGE